MANVVTGIGRATMEGIRELGRMAQFAGSIVYWTFTSLPPRRVVFPVFYEVGVCSLPVVLVTGTFIGMVLAVQMFSQLHKLGAQNAAGMIINLSMVKELGPVLAAVILAGRVGGAMSAELGTMRVTEQIDALRAMGSSPLRVLVVPRLLACVLLIPVLVIYADFMGILGGYMISVYIYGVSGSEFWRGSQQVVERFDIFYGPIKSVFFGAAMSLICCYKGFRCAPGAAGVGRACTESFVASCMAMLALDFFLGMALNTLYESMYGLKVVL